jgi:broad specificity phosphatase PhoE
VASTLFVRHAQASFGAEVYDRLSTLGRQQARLTGQYVDSVWGPIARIFCGTLERQRATAEEIASCVHFPSAARSLVQIEPRLDELDVDGQISRYARHLNDASGELAGWLAEMHRSSGSYQKVIHRVFTHWQSLSNDDGGESWTVFVERIMSACRDILGQACSGETTVVVSSGAVIATVAQQILGLPPSGTYTLFEVMKNCSITHVLHTGNRWSLSSFNETAHLTPVGGFAKGQHLITYR